MCMIMYASKRFCPIFSILKCLKSCALDISHVENQYLAKHSTKCKLIGPYKVHAIYHILLLHQTTTLTIANKLNIITSQILTGRCRVVPYNYIPSKRHCIVVPLRCMPRQSAIQKIMLFQSEYL